MGAALCQTPAHTENIFNRSPTASHSHANTRFCTHTHTLAQTFKHACTHTHFYLFLSFKPYSNIPPKFAPLSFILFWRFQSLSLSHPNTHAHTHTTTHAHALSFSPTLSPTNFCPFPLHGLWRLGKCGSRIQPNSNLIFPWTVKLAQVVECQDLSLKGFRFKSIRKLFHLFHSYWISKATYKVTPLLLYSGFDGTLKSKCQ